MEMSVNVLRAFIELDFRAKGDFAVLTEIVGGIGQVDSIYETDASGQTRSTLRC